MSFRDDTVFGIEPYILEDTVDVEVRSVYKIHVGREHGCTSTEALCNHAEAIVNAGNFEGPPERQTVEAVSF